MNAGHSWHEAAAAYAYNEQANDAHRYDYLELRAATLRLGLLELERDVRVRASSLELMPLVGRKRLRLRWCSALGAGLELAHGEHVRPWPSWIRCGPLTSDTTPHTTSSY